MDTILGNAELRQHALHEPLSLVEPAASRGTIRLAGTNRYGILLLLAASWEETKWHPVCMLSGSHAETQRSQAVRRIGRAQVAADGSRVELGRLQVLLRHAGLFQEVPMKKTMKAVRIHEYGGPEVLRYEDAQVPDLAPDDVLVEVHAAAVNPVDWKVRQGYLKERMRYELPLIVGWDVSGHVASVGSAVTRFQPGDEVFGRTDIARNGAYAEYIAVRESELAPKPKTLDHVHAAAVPLTALTAWQALLHADEPFHGAKVERGQKVLIHGAAGGVGSFAVQLAHWRDAHVIGTGSVRSRDFLEQLGVDEFVDYEQQSFEQVVQDVDVVLDTIGGETQEKSWKVLRSGGTLVSIITPPSEELAQRHHAHSGYVFVQPNSEQLLHIRELLDEGTLRVFVSQVLPLSDARTAHEQSQTGHTHGKIVLRVSD